MGSTRALGSQHWASMPSTGTRRQPTRTTSLPTPIQAPARAPPPYEPTAAAAGAVAAAQSAAAQAALPAAEEPAPGPQPQNLADDPHEEEELPYDEHHDAVAGHDDALAGQDDDYIRSLEDEVAALRGSKRDADHAADIIDCSRGTIYQSPVTTDESASPNAPWTDKLTKKQLTALSRQNRVRPPSI